MICTSNSMNEFKLTMLNWHKKLITRSFQTWTVKNYVDSHRRWTKRNWFIQNNIYFKPVDFYRTDNVFKIICKKKQTRKSVSQQKWNNCRLFLGRSLWKCYSHWPMQIIHFNLLFVSLLVQLMIWILSKLIQYKHRTEAIRKVQHKNKWRKKTLLNSSGISEYLKEYQQSSRIHQNIWLLAHVQPFFYSTRIFFFNKRSFVIEFLF